jgi:hypothetical protein
MENKDYCDGCKNRGVSKLCHSDECLCYQDTGWYIDECLEKSDCKKLAFLAHMHRNAHTRLRTKVNAAKSSLGF